MSEAPSEASSGEPQPDLTEAELVDWAVEVVHEGADGVPLTPAAVAWLRAHLFAHELAGRRGFPPDFRRKLATAGRFACIAALASATPAVDAAVMRSAWQRMESEDPGRESSTGPQE